MGKLKWSFLWVIVFFIAVNLFVFPFRVSAITEADQSKLGKCVILYIGSPNSYVNTIKTKIDSDNGKVVPIIKNGRTLVPVRFISESLSASVNWDRDTSTVMISLNGNTAVLKPGKHTMLLNNEEKGLDVPAEIIEGRTYLPLRRLVEDVLEKNIFYNRGLIIISEKDNSFDKDADKSLIDDLIYIYGKDNATTHISGGNDHTVAIKEDGTVWAWGDYGDRNIPIPERVPNLDDVIDVSAGSKYTLALKSDGIVWCWGEINSGSGDKRYINTPVKMEKLTGVKKISAAYDGHCLAMKSDGTVWTWGIDLSLEIGPEPVLVDGLSNIVDIAAESYYSFALDKDGAVWTWGENKSELPEKVKGISGVIDVSAGQSHVLALKNDGTVWVWKYDDQALVYSGQQEGADLSVPIQVKELSGIVAISARGGGHSIALKDDGSVYIWGSNWYKDESNYLTPVMISELSGVREIASGNGHLLALKNDGSLWAFGGNGNGQIGDGSFITRKKPAITLFNRNPLKTEVLDVSAENKLAYEFDSQTEEVLDGLAEKIMSEYGYDHYEKFVQRDKMEVVIVDNAKEFINSIQPNCEIILKTGEVYNLAEAVNEVANSKYVHVDGSELIIKGIENLIIRSESADPVKLENKGFANILNFEDSMNIIIDGIYAVHELKSGSLSSDVLSFSNCQKVCVNNSILSGGSNGAALSKVNGFVFDNSVIRDCKGGIMNILDSSNIIFNNSKFKNTVVSSDLINIMSSKNVLFTSCEISNNVVVHSGEDSKYQLFNGYFVEPILLVRDTVIQNNEADYMRVYEDDIYFKNTAFDNNSFAKGVYEFD
ncbi:stalk domain-containing protein [Acetivibrio cellulolyticus]|uniref:stalk domain-containing protein n=1 Tax=Acetivibrio cellulolyticus TaxID=35830 RepID=UPI0001E3014D|nr:stalk domain-containing protein [Acetivibrio cellulolyticus]